MRPSSPICVARAPWHRLALALLAASAVACSSGQTDEAPLGAEASAPEASATPGAPAPTADLASKAQQAVADNRIYAPAGDNAIEFYLAQRENAPSGENSAEAALIELQPYAMMAAEQAIAGADFAEAERLIALMVRIDATAPSLTRLRGDLDAARQAQAAAEAAEAEADATEAAQAAAPPPTPIAPAANPAPRPPASAPSRAAPAATRPAATNDATRTATAGTTPERPTAAPLAPPSPAPRPAPPTAAGPLVPVSTPFPPFPSEAIARGRSMGTVTVRFTVRANGRVADIQVVEARPEGLFERTVIETLEGWRFEPTAADQTQTRTFDFRN